MITPPLLLLVEDDPTSRDFLRAALRALPAVVDCAASMADALRCARARRHDLWLIDAHLPDGSGLQLLARLRSSGASVPALAHTAADDPALLESLRRQGFDEVVCKPLSAQRLQAIVRRHLGGADAGAAWHAPIAEAPDEQVWDDAAALAALHGHGEHVAALRGLFLAELPGQLDAVVRAAHAGDTATLGDHLHRLRASCGFTGAARLAQAARALASRPGHPAALADFEAAVAATLETLPETATG